MERSKSTLLAGLFLFFVVGFFFLTPSLVGAVEAFPPDNPAIATNSIPVFLSKFYDFSIMIGAIAAVLMVIAGAVVYMTAASIPSQKSRGREIIAGALWGLALLLGAYLILKTINPNLVNLGGGKLPQTDFRLCSGSYPQCKNGEPERNPETGECQCTAAGGAQQQNIGNVKIIK